MRRLSESIFMKKLLFEFKILIILLQVNKPDNSSKREVSVTTHLIVHFLKVTVLSLIMLVFDLQPCSNVSWTLSVLLLRSYQVVFRPQQPQTLWGCLTYSLMLMNKTYTQNYTISWTFYGSMSVSFSTLFIRRDEIRDLG